ncbi:MULTISPECIES: copper chaperone PCu(A)C [unclassified Streptomyces]|uniref:copper chaperone PCu(A)C n=1 Tax=unclassified Streptomyces TaxID=2593676 RepID=UPI0036652C85
MRRTPFAVALVMTAGLALAGCSADSGPELKVSGAFMPQPVGDDMAAGFLTVVNNGGTADKLTSVTSDLSDDITIHTSKDQRMQQVKAFDVPADGSLDLERGGSHIMFMALKQKPEKGQKVSVELHFEKSGPIRVELPVKEATYNPAKH